MESPLTAREIAPQLDPPMNQRQIATLITIAGIQPLGTQPTGLPGRPPRIYDAAEVRQAHAEEAARTIKQFINNDWIAAALLARNLIRAETEPGELWWPDGTRAEELHPDLYGWVRVSGETVAAHRVLWIAAEGEIPDGLQINHINGLKWDNRRANFELVTFGNNILHHHRKPYLNYHDAVSQLAGLDPEPPETISPYGGKFAGGRIIGGSRTRRPGH